MKKLAILLFILVVCVGVVSADRQILIDFSTLEADEEFDERQMHSSSMIDFSAQAGASYTIEEKKRMLISLALDEWDVELASSSQTVENMRYSKCKESVSRKFGKVLGARIHFPTGHYNSFALVKPPFEIPAFQHPTVFENGEIRDMTDEEMNQINEQRGVKTGEPGFVDKNSKYDGMGVIKNVGNIKSIKVQVYGSNYPHGLSMRYKDQTGATHDIFMDHLNFDGWKEIVWKNPNYIKEVRDRELGTMPLYPQAYPFMKFIGFIVHRDGANIGSDFVIYFKDIEVIYDKAVITVDRDIDDEGEWGILSERETARRAAEIRRVGNVQVLRWLEKKKQSPETEVFEETEGQE
jgi:hypothetical protein